MTATPRRLAEAVALTESGLTRAEVAERMSTTTRTVYHYLYRAGYGKARDYRNVDEPRLRQRLTWHRERAAAIEETLRQRSSAGMVSE